MVRAFWIAMIGSMVFLTSEAAQATKKDDNATSNYLDHIQAVGTFEFGKRLSARWFTKQDVTSSSTEKGDLLRKNEDKIQENEMIRWLLEVSTIND